jgi:hypothetical protein
LWLTFLLKEDEPINISNRAYYKAELAMTLENLEDENYLNESLLDELQAKIYLLMKQKYYPEFKKYPEFHKLLHKNDLIFKIASKDRPTSTSLSSSGSSTQLNLLGGNSRAKEKNEPMAVSPNSNKKFEDDFMEEDLTDLDSSADTSTLMHEYECSSFMFVFRVLTIINASFYFSVELVS